MAWPKGKPRPDGAGRKKGTPNKDTRTLEEICLARNINPFEALLTIYAESLDESVRLNAIKEACKYIYPQRKAIEHTGSFEVKDRELEHVSDEELDVILGHALPER